MSEREKAFDTWWLTARGPVLSQSIEDIALLAWQDAWQAATLAAYERCVKIAIQKGIGNGHMETCAWIADAIRAQETGH